MRPLFSVVALTLLLAAPLGAQKREHTRQGFWFSGGLGYGSLGCQDCDGREGGFSGGISLGGTVSRKVLLGVSSNAWTKSESGVTLTAGALTAAVRFYPSATGGFFLTGGLGVGTVDLAISGLGSASETGFGALLGLGIDIRIGRNVSLTPFWNGVGISASDADANFGQIGLSITAH
jgi:hypothetical protein